MLRRTFLALPLALVVSGRERRKGRPRTLSMTATAHSVEGETAKGTRSRPGTAAADPAVLPLGSKVRVSGAGRYSGRYSIEDTGTKVDGRHIDIYLSSNAEAKRFGKQRVTVTVLEYGDNERKEAASR